MDKQHKTVRIYATVLLVIGFFGLGIYLGLNHKQDIEKIISINSKESVALARQTDFSSFWKVWNLINEKYPESQKITDEERVYGAISGLVGSLNDPYSVFFKPDEAKTFQEDISGNFTGVGMEVGMKDKVLTVIAPLKNTPAEKAGIKSGDKILKIDKTVTSDLSLDQAIKLIRGEKGTTVTLMIFQEGETEPKEIKIVRDIINTPVLDSELRKDGIYVIHLYNFSANSSSLFDGAMKKFYASKSNKLIIDLRGNPGGYLDASISMGSYFIPSGKTVVIENYGQNNTQKIYRSKGGPALPKGFKAVILIDGGSASASEILAGAMQDYGLAKLVGTQSYGKGSVQEVLNVTPDTLLKVTVAKWLTPNGKSISEKGLTPDYKVELTKKDIEAKKDPQMEKALELLK